MFDTPVTFLWTVSSMVFTSYKKRSTYPLMVNRTSRGGYPQVLRAVVIPWTLHALIDHGGSLAASMALPDMVTPPCDSS